MFLVVLVFDAHQIFDGFLLVSVVLAVFVCVRSFSWFWSFMVMLPGHPPPTISCGVHQIHHGSPKVSLTISFDFHQVLVVFGSFGI